ncbi:MAG: AAA family ATPase, partial [Kibdelosporangium sp.]
MDITVENRALVVVAGLPGSGKSTLLRRTWADVPIAVIDTDHIRSWLARVLPPNIPYAVCRPFVHLVNTTRVLLALLFSSRVVVLHDPATGAATRTVFALLGALTRRPRHLVWIDCTAEEALAGQIARGRVLLSWSFARHMRKSPAVRAQLIAGRTPPGWHSARLVSRETASAGLKLHVGLAV